MEKVDRLGWAAGFSFEAYGVVYGVRTNEPEAIERLKSLLPYGSVRSRVEKVDTLFSLFLAPPSRPGVRRYHLLYNGAARIIRTLEREEAFDALDHTLSAWIPEFSTTALFVHAGVVEWRGRAIVIPGRTWTGKSSLVAAFVKAGARYYSDEFALITRTSRVAPFARPLSLRLNDRGDRIKIDPETFAGERAVKSIPIGLVLVTRYQEGARFAPRRLSPGESVLALLANTVPARRRARVAISRLRGAVVNAVTLKGTRGEASNVAARILARPPWERIARGDANVAGPRARLTREGNATLEHSR